MIVCIIVCLNVLLEIKEWILWNIENKESDDKESVMITNFTFKELIKTDTGLDNLPNDMNIIKNLVKVTEFLQVIRNELHLPIIVTSGYRSKEVNDKVGGVYSSYHCKGLAADIKCKDMDKLLSVLHSHLMEIDQLGIYYNSSEQLWYHVGLPEEGKVPRNQIYTKEIK